MKKTIFAALALAGVMTTSLCACDNSANNGSEFAQAGENRTTVTQTETYTGLSSAESVYAMGAVTTAGFFASGTSAAPLSGRIRTASASTLSASVKTVSATEDETQTTEEPDQTATEDQAAAKEEASDFNQYLGAIETFLNEEQLTTTVEQNTDEAFAEYDIKMTVTGKDIGGGDVVHVLYYTETFTRTENKTKDDKTEYKTAYSITGVMTLGGETYTVRGERKEEEKTDTEGSELESETTIRAYRNEEDKRSYVQMVYSTESEEENGETEEERSYTYTVVENGVFQEKTVVKYETEEENGEQETKYSVFFYGAETGARSVYSIEREYDENGCETLKVFYLIFRGAENGGTEGENGWKGWNENYGANVERGYYRVVKDENGDYVYTFVDGSQLRYHKIHK